MNARSVEPDPRDSRWLTDRVLSLVRSLREEGVSIPAHAGVDGLDALSRLPSLDRLEVREALCSTFISDPSDRAVFERLFRRFWFDLWNRGKAAGPENQTVSTEVEDSGSDSVDSSAPDRSLEDNTSLRKKTGEWNDDRIGSESNRRTEEPAEAGAFYSPAGDRIDPDSSPDGGFSHDLDREAVTFCRAVARSVGRKRGTGRRDPLPDVRRALRENLQTGGVLLDLPRRERRVDRSELVMVADVSRSVLDVIPPGYLLNLLKTLHATARQVDVLLFDHDVQDITPLLDREDRTLEDVRHLTEALQQWGGGTRIGRAIDDLRNRLYDRIHSRSCVVIMSDGLDQGEIDRLRRGMAWLRRRSGLLLWFNPLASDRHYEPETRGMKEALPFLDGLFALRGPGDLAEVSRQLPRMERGREAGYRFDPRRRASA